MTDHNLSKLIIQALQGLKALYYIARGDLKLLIFLLLPHKSWNDHQTSPCLVYVMCGIEPGILCITRQAVYQVVVAFHLYFNK